MREFLLKRREVFAHGAYWHLRDDEGIDRAILEWAGWEFDSTRIVGRVLKPGMVAVDVGANIGWYTVQMAKLVGPSGCVMAFEPMRDPRALLEWHVALNDLGRCVRVYPYALSDDEAVLDTHFPYANPDGRHFDPGLEQVHVRRLDEFAQTRFDLIKIDVDGRELRVLQGAAEIIARYKPMLLFEICDSNLFEHSPTLNKSKDRAEYAYGLATRELFAFLRSFGYGFWYEDSWPAPRIEGRQPPAEEIVLESIASVEALLERHPLEHMTTNVFACVGEPPWGYR